MDKIIFLSSKVIIKTSDGRTISMSPNLYYKTYGKNKSSIKEEDTPKNQKICF